MQRHGIALNAHSGTPLDVGTFDERRRDELQSMLAAKGLGITSVLDMTLNLLHPDEDERASMIANARKLIDLTSDLGVGVFVTFAGRDPEKSAADNIPRFKEVLTPLADYAGERNVRIAFENCPLFHGFPYRGRNIAYAPAVWDMMFEAVPSPDIGICLDTSHPVMLMLDLERIVADYADRICDVQLKDSRIDRDRLQREGIYGEGWTSAGTPGSGDVDWPRFFDALSLVRYEGNFTIDLHGPNSRPNTELPRGLAHVRPLVERAFAAVAIS